MSWICWLVTVAVTLLVGLRFAALQTPLVVQVLAFYPYLMIAAVLLTLLPWLAKRRAAALVMTAVVLLGVAPLLPRVWGGATYDDADGSDLIAVATVNTLYGRAEPEEIVAIAQEVDVLALQEVTEESLEQLSQAGLDSALPHHITDLRPGAGGSGIWARDPLRSEPVRPSIFSSPQVWLERPGKYEIRVRGVHVFPPVSTGFGAWRRELQALAGAPHVEVMLGDFNATLDHHAFREVLRAGWTPVGNAVGKGLTATWPAGSSLLPGIAIDHILVGPNAGPSWMEIRPVSGTDHKALIAELVIPLR